MNFKKFFKQTTEMKMCKPFRPETVIIIIQLQVEAKRKTPIKE